MVDILEHYQRYCPRVNGKLWKILWGGDGLNTKRGSDALRARADQSLEEGLVPQSEDWHKAILWLQVD